MGDRITKQLCLNALKMAKGRILPQADIIHHSDRGSQYASVAYQTALEKIGAICSMSRKGNCWDNAPMESFFDKLKTEHLSDFRFKTRQEARSAVFDYIEIFYNQVRIQEGLGGKSPAQYERLWRENQALKSEVKLAAA